MGPDNRQNDPFNTSGTPQQPAPQFPQYGALPPQPPAPAPMPMQQPQPVQQPQQQPGAPVLFNVAPPPKKRTGCASFLLL